MGGGSTESTELAVGRAAGKAAGACWGAWVDGDQVLSLAGAEGGGVDPALRFWL